MIEKVSLAKLLGKDKFERIEGVFRRHFQLGLETRNIHGKEIGQMCSGDCNPAFCRIVQSSKVGLRRCNRERRRSLETAIETGQSYISLCHAGIVLVCVPVMDKDKSLGGIFFGKCLWEPVTQILIRDVEKRLDGICVNRKRLTAAMRELPFIQGWKIDKAAQFLFDLLYEVAAFDGRVVRWRRERSEQQSQIGEFIQEKKKLGTEWQYPLESERELMGKVKIGDRTGAKEILNSILGTILFKTIGDLGILKARMLELLSILSRSAVEGGVDIDVMLEKNLNYVNKVMRINNQEDLCAWISTALNEFIELVYSSQDARKVSQIRPAINYIDANYNKPITLADVARASHLSVSRLAHIFKEQMGVTIIDYLTSVRIERAKQLLLATDQNCTEICFEVGYNNQSYFTRTFKGFVGMTPRQFRTKNQRKEKISTPL
ncbi:MAG: helix-turn-helix domain-containing protein [Planctomycetes bacterium]|nr:helix-turn-helix domain-containing protein [Planctomycetota bacterium]MBL7143176.1 helix-turn-helix domain-containing protein [Phycisphaerae bacterium]